MTHYLCRVITYLLAITVSLTSNAVGIYVGDLNYDGHISVSDLTLLMKFLQKESLSENLLNLADINHDKIISLDDALQLQNIITCTSATCADTLALYYCESDVYILNPFPSNEISIKVSQDIAEVCITNHSPKHLIIAACGKSSNGQLKINSTQDIELHLQGLVLTSRSGPAIYSTSPQKMKIVIAAQTQNFLEDAESYTLPESEIANGCLSCMGGLSIFGDGSITLTAHNKHAIYSKKSITVSSGNIIVDRARSDALHSGKHVNINGGKLHLTGMEGDAIDLDDDFTMNAGTLITNITGEAAKGIKCGGHLKISGGNIVAEGSGALKNKKGDLSYCTLLKCDSSAVITGGQFTMVNHSPGGRCISVGTDAVITGGTSHLTTFGDGAQYINTDCITDYYTAKCITIGGNLYLHGGTLHCHSSGIGGKGIVVGGNFYGGRKEIGTDTIPHLNIETQGGSVVDDVANDNREGCPKALKIGMFGYVYEGRYELLTHGMGGEGIEARGLKIYDGDIICNTYDDGINILQSMMMKGGNVYCNSTDNDGIDSNGSITISGGTVFSASQHIKDEPFDTEGSSLHINGGTVIGIGHSVTDIGRSSQPVHVDRYQYFPIASYGHYEVRDQEGHNMLKFTSTYDDSECRCIISLQQFTTTQTYYIYDETDQQINILKPIIINQ